MNGVDVTILKLFVLFINSPEGLANRLSVIESGDKVQSQLMRLICKGVVITGALLIGDNVCEMREDSSRVNISNQIQEAGRSFSIQDTTQLITTMHSLD